MALTQDAQKLMHGSCRHIHADGIRLVVVTADGIVTTPRPADRFEVASLTTFGKLCFAAKP